MAQMKCLILVPRTDQSTYLRSMLESALFNRNVAPIALDSSVPYGAPITDVSDTVRQTIELADMIIADLSGSNPNVMYEVGYAHALKKPVLPLLKKGEQQIPSDLSGYLYYVYDPLNIVELQRVVETWVQRTAASNPKR